MTVVSVVDAPLHRFFYWRVAPDHLETALAVTRAWQEGLMQQRPALAARLYARSEPGRATVMETYVADDGHVAALRSEGDSSSAPWRQGERHLESFSQVT